MTNKKKKSPIISNQGNTNQNQNADWQAEGAWYTPGFSSLLLASELWNIHLPNCHVSLTAVKCHLICTARHTQPCSSLILHWQTEGRLHFSISLGPPSAQLAKFFWDPALNSPLALLAQSQCPTACSSSKHTRHRSHLPLLSYRQRDTPSIMNLSRITSCHTKSMQRKAVGISHSLQKSRKLDPAHSQQRATVVQLQERIRHWWAKSFELLDYHRLPFS